MHDSKPGLLILCTVLSLLGATSAWSETDPSEPRPASGLTIHIDPDTGEILTHRPTDPAMLRADQRLLQSLSRSDAGLTETRLPDGSVRVDLEGRFHHVNAARLTDESGVEQMCANHPSKLHRFLDRSASTTTQVAGGER